MISTTMSFIGSTAIIFGMMSSSSAQTTPDPSQQPADPPQGDFVLEVSDTEIKLMSYNAENLFDTEHDEGNIDYQYLPIDHPLKEMCNTLSSSRIQRCLETDWNKDVLDRKLNQLATVIRASGSIPDVVGLQEVENLKVIKKLADKLDYDEAIIGHGPDVRGIRVGMLYNDDKLKHIETREHTVKYNPPPDVDPNHLRPTRNVMEVIFKVKGTDQYLAVYVNHWPSQGTPNSGWKRVDAARTVKSAINRSYYAFDQEKFHAVVLGDFNTLGKDRPHPYHSVLLQKVWSKHLLNDVQWMYDNLPSVKSLPGRSTARLPRGTYFYRKNIEWNVLDRFFPSQNLRDGKGLEILPESFRVVTPKAATDIVRNTYGLSTHGSAFLVPNRFNPKETDPANMGASDHFGVVVKLKLNKTK